MQKARDAEEHEPRARPWAVPPGQTRHDDLLSPNRAADRLLCPGMDQPRTLTLRIHITVEGDRLAFRPLGNGQRGCGVDRGARGRELPAGTNPPAAVCSPRRQSGVLQAEGSRLTSAHAAARALQALPLTESRGRALSTLFPQPCRARGHTSPHAAS